MTKSTTVAYAAKLKELIFSLKERQDLIIKVCEISDPVSPEKLESFRKKLPDCLLDFYTVMDGCNFRATLKSDKDISLGITIPPVTQAGTFMEDNTDFNFKQGTRFIPVEWADPTGTTFFILENGSNDLESAFLVSCLAGKENDYLKTYPDLGEFLKQCMESNLLVLWFVKDKARELQKRKLKKILSEAPKTGKGLQKDDMVSHKLAGSGIVLDKKELSSHFEYYSNDWALVEFYQTGIKLWVQENQLRKLPKKPEKQDKAFIKPLDFIKCLNEYSPSESAMLLSSVFYYNKNNSVDLGVFKIPETTYKYHGIFRHISLDEMIGLSTGLILSWIEGAGKGILEEMDYVEKKGSFGIKAEIYPWLYFEVMYSLMAALGLRIMEQKIIEPGYVVPANRQQKIIQAAEKIRNLPLGDNSYNNDNYAEHYQYFMKMLDYLEKNEKENNPQSGLYKGSTLPADLVSAGLDEEYGYISV